MKTDTGLDLRTMIRDAFASTPNAREAWEKVESQLDGETVWDAVRIMGPSYALQVGGSMRTSSLGGGSGRPDPLTKLMPQGKARKAAAYTERWEQAMASPVPVSDDGSKYKRLGDCTLEDVAFAAGVRRKHEAANRAWAEKYEALVEKMRVYRAETVAALDPAYFWEAVK